VLKGCEVKAASKEKKRFFFFWFWGFFCFFGGGLGGGGGFLFWGNERDKDQRGGQGVGHLGCVKADAHPAKKGNAVFQRMNDSKEQHQREEERLSFTGDSRSADQKGENEGQRLNFQGRIPGWGQGGGCTSPDREHTGSAPVRKLRRDRKNSKPIPEGKKKKPPWSQGTVQNKKNLLRKDPSGD